MFDWGDGDYAPTAKTLEPATAATLDAVGLRPGERLIDVGCGNGNALLEAARRGAEVAGLDPSAGLVEQAAERLAGAGFSGDVRVGTAEAPPEGLGAGDAVVSVFAVIFAPEPPAAIKGLVSLCRPGGRLALTTWLSGGAISAAGQILRAAFVPADAPPPPPPPPWHDPDWITGLLQDAGAQSVTVTEHQLVFRHDSPEAWFAEQETDHPVWLTARGLLGEDAWQGVRERTVAALHEGNEDPGAFAASSGYLVVRAAR
jgi:SAM-dependent methyltransferase